MYNKKINHLILKIFTAVLSIFLFINNFSFEPDLSASSDIAINEHSNLESSDDSGSLYEFDFPEEIDSKLKDDNAEIFKMNLYKESPDDSVKIKIDNMLPGDTLTKYFCVRVCHDCNAKLFFNINTSDPFLNTDSTLHVKITELDSGKVMCDDTFSKVKANEYSINIAPNVQNGSLLYYKMDIVASSEDINSRGSLPISFDAYIDWYVKDKSLLTADIQSVNTAYVSFLIVSELILFAIVLYLFLKRKTGKVIKFMPLRKLKL